MVLLIIFLFVYLVGISLLFTTRRWPMNATRGYLPGLLVLGFVLLGIAPTVLIRQGSIAEAPINVLVAILYFISFVIVASYMITKKKVRSDKQR